MAFLYNRWASSSGCQIGARRDKVARRGQATRSRVIVLLSEQGERIEALKSMVLFKMSST